MAAESLFDGRLIIVSGKGGTGKTTVAAAIALAAVRSGRRVLLAEVEGRGGLARLFSTRPFGHGEVALATDLMGIAVEPDEAMLEYLHLFHGMRRISRVLAHSRAVEFATTVAPGLRDILVIGKLKQVEGRRENGVPVYDLIVLDAPPTGRIVPFLSAPRAASELARLGPIHSQAEAVRRLVEDTNKTKVVLTTLLEEMCVSETLETTEKLRAAGMTAVAVVANGVYPRRLEALRRNASASAAEDLLAAARQAGLSLDREGVEELLAEGKIQRRRLAAQRSQSRVLAKGTDLPVFELPFVFAERIGPVELEGLAAAFAAGPAGAGRKGSK